MPKTASKSSASYDVHPGVAMVQKWIAELKPKTGRSLEEWIALVKKQGPKEYQARRAWLKSKHNSAATRPGGLLSGPTVGVRKTRPKRT